jgi:hypothetical protein
MEGAIEANMAAPTTPAIVGTGGGPMGQAPLDGGFGPGIAAPFGASMNTPVNPAQPFSASYGDDDDTFDDIRARTKKKFNQGLPPSQDPAQQDPNTDMNSLDQMAELMHRQLAVSEQQLAISKKQNRNIEGLEI